jgi:hypothetical protein
MKGVCNHGDASADQSPDQFYDKKENVSDDADPAFQRSVFPPDQSIGGFPVAGHKDF